MKRIKTIKVPTVVFLIGILLLAIVMQSAGPRKRLLALSSTYNQTWAANTSQDQSSDTKKQLPISTNIIEEEDKIVEDFEMPTSHHPVLIVSSFSFPRQFFDEPLLTVVGLPPWA
jgi:hypothetical protein